MENTMNMETTNMEPVIEAPAAENYDVPTEVVAGSPASGILGKVVVGGIVTAVTAGVVWLTSKGKKYTTLPNQAIGGALVGKMTKK